MVRWEAMVWNVEVSTVKVGENQRWARVSGESGRCLGQTVFQGVYWSIRVGYGRHRQGGVTGVWGEI